MACTLDVDGDGAVLATSDGVLVVRYLFGFDGASLVGGAASPGGARTEPGEIVDYLDACSASMLDADGDVEALPLTDGVLILRRLFDFSGDPLIENAVAGGCMRCTSADIESHVDSYRSP